MLPFKSEKLNNFRNSTGFLLMFYEFAYFLCFIPFRIVDVKNQFQIRTWRPQKILCAILNLLGIFRLFTELRQSSQHISNFEDNPLMYLRIFVRIFALLYKVTTLKRFWMNSKEYLKVLNCIKKEAMLPHPNAPVLNVWITRMIFTLCAGLAFTDVAFGVYFVPPTSDLTLKWWIRQLVSLTRFTFCYGPAPQLNEAPPIKDINGVDVILSLFTVVGLHERYVSGLFCDLCILSHVVTLWSVAHTFAEDLKQQSDSYSDQDLLCTKEGLPVNRKTWAVVYSEYKAIRKLALTINAALSGTVTGFMAEAIIFYSIYLVTTLVTQDVYMKIFMIYFYLNTCGILFISASACAQMGIVKTWLADDENRKSVPLDEMQIVLNEIAEKDIGIRGSNAFTITYSSVFSFCSLVVTYFIISVQNNKGLPKTPLDS